MTRLYEDIKIVRRGIGWMVIDKPSGLLSVPGKGEANRVCAAVWVRENPEFAGVSGPVTVHRLDMDTSGLLLMGLDEASQRALSMQFEARTVEKAYVALVSGRVEGERGVVELPMRLDVARRPVQIVDHEQGKAAVTEWRVVGRGEGVTRLELTPRTGRTHQLRVHCAEMGHAIVGDKLYGEGGGRLCLHASRLVFSDPGSGERIVVESAAPF